MPNTSVPADGEAMPTATAFLAVTPQMRSRLAATCEALIALLDEIDGDENLEETGDDEPSLGWTYSMGRPVIPTDASDDRELDNADYEPWLGSLEMHPASYENPWKQSGELRYADQFKSQERWSEGALYDGEDDAGENAEPDNDSEHELGWQEEGSQALLRFGSDEEPNLGAPEQVNQVSRLKMKSGLIIEDGEPLLGWGGHGRGWCFGENTDDREQDAGDDREDENEHYDEGQYDNDLHIPGGGSVSQHEDGWRPDPNYVPPIDKPKKGKRPAATSPTVLFRRDEDITPPRYAWNDQWTTNLPPEAFESVVPEISVYWTPK